METFKVGEKVAYNYSWMGNRRVKTILRETKTQYILENDTRIRKADLREVGNHQRSIEKLTDEILAEFKIKRTKAIVSINLDTMNRYRNCIKVKDIEKLIKADMLIKEAANLLGIRLLGVRLESE